MTIAEAIARGIRPQINEDFDDAVDGAWSRDIAIAALAAITEAGYTLAPSEPTEAMLAAASEVKAFATISAYLDEAHLLPSGATNIYRAMISAAQGDAA